MKGKVSHLPHTLEEEAATAETNGSHLIYNHQNKDIRPKIKFS